MTIGQIKPSPRFSRGAKCPSRLSRIRDAPLPRSFYTTPPPLLIHPHPHPPSRFSLPPPRASHTSRSIGVASSSSSLDETASDESSDEESSASASAGHSGDPNAPLASSTAFDPNVRRVDPPSDARVPVLSRYTAGASSRSADARSGASHSGARRPGGGLSPRGAFPPASRPPLGGGRAEAAPTRSAIRLGVDASRAYATADSVAAANDAARRARGLRGAGGVRAEDGSARGGLLFALLAPPSRPFPAAGGFPFRVDAEASA